MNCDLCPAGGDTQSRQGDGVATCPSCEEQYGFCAKTAEFVLEESYVNDEGRIVPAKMQKSCVIDRENACCEAYETVEDIGRLSSGCIRKTIKDGQGREIVVQAALCIDTEEGICADCKVDDDCGPGTKCVGNVCVTQCGQEDSANVGGLDFRGKSLGYKAKDCSCCTNDGECKEIYESWTEGDGTGNCRPCQCTESGIDCAPALPCESCWKWQRVDPDASGEGSLAEDKQHAKSIALEDQMLMLEVEKSQAQIDLDQALPKLEPAEAEVNYWKPIVEACEVICEEDAFGDVPPGCTPDKRRECQEAAQNLQKAEGELEAVQQEITGLEMALDQIFIKQADLQNKLNANPYRPGTWEQVKQCACCIDEQCRPDEECSFGTCYICIEDEVPQYGVKLYGKVTEEPTVCGFSNFEGTCSCTECPSAENDCSRAPSPDCFQPYVKVLNQQCIKYNCSDGLGFFEEPPYGSNERYYEYCTGSIISCALNRPIGNDGDRRPIGEQYMNGWKFQIICNPDGPYRCGSFAGNGRGDVRIAGLKDVETNLQCMYPNRMGHIRGHYLPISFYHSPFRGKWTCSGK